TRGETPALAGVDVAGRTVDLATLRGRAVVVQFWASWCEGCDAELAALVRLRDRLRGRRFDVVTVNYGEGPARIEQVLRARRIDLPVLLDRERRTAEAWGVRGLPTTFLVDAEGRVRASTFGATDFETGELAAALERLLAEAERAPGVAR
ncbi:MAG TPA: TlpA disulfide reductase family protein, partial [Anaeromyxobacteraceae bacterium]|nr:TlpA disulfide reductase family protein [Anaeromyxobacteraceae bacterium]